MNSPKSPSTFASSTRICLVWVPYVPPSVNRTAGNLRKTLAAKRDAKEAWLKEMLWLGGQDPLSAFRSLRASIESAMTTTSQQDSKPSETPSLTAYYPGSLLGKLTHGCDGNTGK